MVYSYIIYKLYPCPWNEYTCHIAAKCGSREIVEWAIAQDPPCPIDVLTREWVDNGYHLGKATLEDMQASWNRAKLKRADYQGI